MNEQKKRKAASSTPPIHSAAVGLPMGKEKAPGILGWLFGNVWKNIVAPSVVAVASGAVLFYFGMSAGKDDTKPSVPPVKSVLASSRSFRKTAEILVAVAQDLRRCEPALRTQRVYLTVQHLHNNPSLSDEALEQFRETLRQLAAYLSPPGAAVVFDPIDADRTVYAFNGADLGLDLERAWPRVLKNYPYGLDYTNSSDAALRQAWLELEKQDGQPLPFVRADWFVQAIVRPPLAGPAGALQLPAKPLPPAVSAWAQHYAEQKVDLATATLEIGMTDSAAVEQKIRATPRLQAQFGLQPLLARGTVMRRSWESLDLGLSPFQELSQTLKLGSPFN